MNVRACVYGFFVVILCAERDRLKNKSNKQKKIIVSIHSIFHRDILKYNHLERVEYLNGTQVN